MTGHRRRRRAHSPRRAWNRELGVALFLPNIPEFAVAYLGVLKLGAIAVSINATSQRDEVGYILCDCGVKVAVTTPDLCEQVPAHAVQRVYVVGEDFEPALDGASTIPAARAMQPDDPAAIVYTSGTTGRPKGATLSHANVVRNIEAKRHYLGIRPDDRGLLFVPLYHCFGQNAVLNALLHAGATVVLHRRFDFDRVLESITTDAVTMFFGVPTTYILLLDKVSRYELSTVRYYFSAAAPMPVEVEEQWAKKFGVPIHQGYGLTETSPFSSYNHFERHRPASIGTPIEGVEMKIVDPETGRDSAQGVKGEIVVRGHNVMLGYWNRPADTANVIRDGWFHTGDIGRVDCDGYFFIEDRLTDVINVGGVNIYPAEIERVLDTHPAVAEGAVYGVPEPLWGERVCADIVLKPRSKASEAEVRAFCRERLAEVKVPTSLHFVEEIPKGPTGKVLKRVLREQGGKRAASRRQRIVTKDEAKRWICAWLQANLDSPLGPDFNCGVAFADLGMNSIAAVRLANEAADWLGRKVEVTAVWNYPSTEDLAEHLAACDEFRPMATDGVAALSDGAAEALLRVELEQLNR